MYKHSPSLCWSVEELRSFTDLWRDIMQCTDLRKVTASVMCNTHSSKNTQMRVVCRDGYSERYKTSLFLSVCNGHRARKNKGPRRPPLYGNRGQCLWHMTTGLGEGRVPVKQQAKSCGQTHIHAPKLSAKKVHFPLQSNVEFLKKTSAGNSPFSSAFETARVRMRLQ